MAEGGFDEIGLDDFNAPEEQYDEEEETSFMDPPGLEHPEQELQEDYAERGRNLRVDYSAEQHQEWRYRLVYSFYDTAFNLQI